MDASVWILNLVILAAKARAATARAGGLATADVLGHEVSAG